MQNFSMLIQVVCIVTTGFWRVKLGKVERCLIQVVCIVTTGLWRVKLGRAERSFLRTETRDGLITKETDKARDATENVHSSVLLIPKSWRVQILSTNTSIPVQFRGVHPFAGSSTRRHYHSLMEADGCVPASLHSSTSVLQNSFRLNNFTRVVFAFLEKQMAFRWTGYETERFGEAVTVSICISWFIRIPSGIL
jgi:hypothetical protein